MMAVELLRMIDDGRLESQFLPAATALLAAILHNCDQARVLFFVSAFFAHIPSPPIPSLSNNIMHRPLRSVPNTRCWLRSATL